jgi:hypothetical protein
MIGHKKTYVYDLGMPISGSEIFLKKERRKPWGEEKKGLRACLGLPFFPPGFFS